MAEKKLTRGKQAELSRKYGKLSDEEIARMEKKNDNVVFIKVLNNMIQAVCNFEVEEDDAEDVAGMLSIYAHMLSFDPILYISLRKASSASAVDQEE